VTQVDRDRAIRLGRIRGIPIKMEWSLLVIVWLLTWSLASGGLPELAPGYPDGYYWAAAVLTTVAFFASLLLHELSHSVVARRRGSEVRDITLWLLGGVSRIEEEPATPSDDLRIALAGPAASIGIAVGGFVIAFSADRLGAPGLVVACLVWLASINILLAVFNLVPAAPLDGGRVLRAILWRRTGDRARAAISATKAGRVFAYVLVVAGFAELFVAAAVSGLWLVLLGWFLLTASRSEETQVRMNRDLAGVRVVDVMTPEPVTVPDGITVERVLHDYVLARHCSSFPVIDAAGSVIGLVTLRQLRALPAAQRAVARVADIARPLCEVPTAAPDELLLDVLRRTVGSAEGRLLVFRDGSLVGIVSPTDVTRAVQVAELEHSR
jgi:Zn-dependent protease/CBS domain-containing protein